MINTAAPELVGAYEALLFKFYNERISDSELEELQDISIQLQGCDQNRRD